MERQYTAGEYGTFFVDTDSNKKMAQLFERNVHPQADELEVFHRYVNSDSTFLDLGAYVGTISVPMAKVAKAVHSFEPVKENRDLLERNIQINNLTNVTVHPVALGSHAGHVSLTLPNPDYDAASFAVQGEGDIPMVTLDSLSLAPSFIKMDVEGYEYEVLKGAAGTIQKHKPVIFFEMNMVETRKQGDWWLRRVPGLLRSYGYELYLPTATGQKRVRSIAWAMFKQAPKAFLKGGLNYSVNFLAIPK